MLSKFGQFNIAVIIFIKHLIKQRSSIDGIGLMGMGLCIIVFKSLAVWLALAIMAYGSYRIFVDTE
jgi:hypothetical protein